MSSNQQSATLQANAALFRDFLAMRTVRVRKLKSRFNLDLENPG
jgi:hypothetical protein